MNVKAKIIRTTNDVELCEGRRKLVNGHSHYCGYCDEELGEATDLHGHCPFCGAEFTTVTDESDPEPYLKGHCVWEAEEMPNTSIGYVFVHREPYNKAPQIIHSSNVKPGERWMAVPEELLEK